MFGCVCIIEEFIQKCFIFFLLDVRGHAGVGAAAATASLQGRILRRRVGTDRGPTGHVLADKRTVLGELATFLNIK